MNVLREDAPAKLGWDVLICVIALMTGLLLPIEVLHGGALQQRLTPWWSVFSLIGILDIVISLNTSFERDGMIVRDRVEIRKRYLKSWFGLDLVANAPFFLSSFLTGTISPLIAVLPLLRLQQLIRVTARWESLQIINTSILRITRYAMAIILIANLGACLWLGIGLADKGPDGWIQRYDYEHLRFLDLYIRSLYWTVTTLATVGYGDIVPKTNREILLGITMMFTGVSLYAFAVGNVVSIFNSLDDGRNEHNKRQSVIASYLSRNGVHLETIQRVRRFNDYQWSRSRGFRPSQMLVDLPEELKTEVMLGILHDTVRQVPLFSLAPAKLKKRLLLTLKPASYPPGTVVLDADEIGQEIMFITRGIVRIETTQILPDSILNVMPGDYLGDLSFFLAEARTARAIATTYVDAFVLDRPVFEALRAHEPRLRQVLHEMARQQSERNQALLLAGIII